MNLKNKTVLFLGDSITEGVGVSSADYNSVSVFQGLCGANVVNYGIGGTRIAKQKNHLSVQVGIAIFWIV